jgi:hypothetical protein
MVILHDPGFPIIYNYISARLGVSRMTKEGDFIKIVIE